jgi:signal transduction histidine kinase
MADVEVPPSGRNPILHWLRPLAATTVAVVVALSLSSQPRPSVQGTGLGVTIALVGLVVGAVLMLRGSRWDWTDTAAPLVIVAASGALIWLKSGGPGVAGLFMAVSYGALRLSLARSLAIAVLGVAALAIGVGHVQRSAGVILSAELGLAAFYVISIFSRRVQEAHNETTRLLAELRESRAAQEQAAALHERSRIAREIHDVLAHSLSGLMLQLEGARMLAASPNSNGELPAALDRAHHLARAGLEEARRAVGALRDEELPGPDMIEQLVSDYSRDSGIASTLELSGEPRPVDARTSLTLFRTAQEALTNTRKHSRAEAVEVQLIYQPDGIRLVVADHGGAGSSLPSATVPGDRPAGYGLTGMRERAELLGGTLRAGPTGDGFRVELWVPA